MFQNAVLNNIITKYHENKLAHAYLIETNNYDYALNEIKKLIKILNCEQEYQDKCQECNLCNLINLNNLPSLKIIEPDGANIKKEQIEKLKQDFSTIPIYSKYNVYIIKNAEKLNASSANSMLKFLEEPTPGILGFFLTNNKDIMMDTIKSRCQNLNLYYEAKDLPSLLNIDNRTYLAYQQKIQEYLDLISTSKFINHKTFLLNTYVERQEIENILKIIFAIYHNNFLKLNHQTYNEEIASIYPLKENSLIINKKLAIISEILLNLSYNVNIELLLDKFVIEMRGCYE